MGSPMCFSMDITALYPFIKKEMTVKATMEAIKATNFEGENIYVEHLKCIVALTT